MQTNTHWGQTHLKRVGVQQRARQEAGHRHTRVQGCAKRVGNDHACWACIGVRRTVVHVGPEEPGWHLLRVHVPRVHTSGNEQEPPLCTCMDVSEHKHCASLRDTYAHKIWDGHKPPTSPAPCQAHGATVLVFPSLCPMCPAGRWCHPVQGLWERCPRAMALQKGAEALCWDRADPHPSPAAPRGPGRRGRSS